MTQHLPKHSFGDEALHVFQAWDRGDAEQDVVRDSLLLNVTDDLSKRAQIHSVRRLMCSSELEIQPLCTAIVLFWTIFPIFE